MGVATPVFINCRDRVSDLRLLVEWLEEAGFENITLIDNDSTWPPLLEYLDQTPHRLVRIDHNCGKLALWDAGLVPDAPFVLTDPDVVPLEECPHDLIDHLQDLLDRYPQWSKAGLGLYLDDVPSDMPSLVWERFLVSPEHEIEPGAWAREVCVDTTFALYRPGSGFSLDGIRTGYPYQARHLPWYRREIDMEHRYYLDHAKRGPEGSSWMA